MDKESDQDATLTQVASNLIDQYFQQLHNDDVGKTDIIEVIFAVLEKEQIDTQLVQDIIDQEDALRLQIDNDLDQNDDDDEVSIANDNIHDIDEDKQIIKDIADDEDEDDVMKLRSKRDQSNKKKNPKSLHKRHCMGSSFNTSLPSNLINEDQFVQV
ncbi:MAG: hypothetical protein EZS28_022533 [Streblomastix strix]|uniref:Uncharacterized protein n=1 Tax=Streblomastix strix TaxID=222440 RepID=A0A5J4VH91_9EUKA|nr:MAG: hypothetical protein EZS28_022533 [Streblomastix strix]